MRHREFICWRVRFRASTKGSRIADELRESGRDILFRKGQGRAEKAERAENFVHRLNCWFVISRC